MILRNQKEIQSNKCSIQTQVEAADEVVVVEAMVVAKQEISSSSRIQKTSKVIQVEEKIIVAGGAREVVASKGSNMTLHVIIVGKMVICRLLVIRSKMM